MKQSYWAVNASKQTLSPGRPVAPCPHLQASQAHVHPAQRLQQHAELVRILNHGNVLAAERNRPSQFGHESYILVVRRGHATAGAVSCCGCIICWRVAPCPGGRLSSGGPGCSGFQQSSLNHLCTHPAPRPHKSLPPLRALLPLATAGGPTHQAAGARGVQAACPRRRRRLAPCAHRVGGLRAQPAAGHGLRAARGLQVGLLGQRVAGGGYGCSFGRCDWGLG